MKELDTKSECCEECLHPEHDIEYIFPSGHTVVTAYPESCRNEDCDCHILPIEVIKGYHESLDIDADESGAGYIGVEKKNAP